MSSRLGRVVHLLAISLTSSTHRSPTSSPGSVGRAGTARRPSSIGWSRPGCSRAHRRRRSAGRRCGGRKLVGPFRTRAGTRWSRSASSPTGTRRFQDRWLADGRPGRGHEDEPGTATRSRWSVRPGGPRRRRSMRSRASARGLTPSAWAGLHATPGWWPWRSTNSRGPSTSPPWSRLRALARARSSSPARATPRDGEAGPPDRPQHHGGRPNTSVVDAARKTAGPPGGGPDRAGSRPHSSRQPQASAGVVAKAVDLEPHEPPGTGVPPPPPSGRTAPPPA